MENKERRINSKERVMYDSAKSKKIKALQLMLLYQDELYLPTDFFMTAIQAGDRVFKEVSLLRGHVEEFEKTLDIKLEMTPSKKIHIKKN